MFHNVGQFVHRIDDEKRNGLFGQQRLWDWRGRVVQLRGYHAVGTPNPWYKGDPIHVPLFMYSLAEKAALRSAHCVSCRTYITTVFA